MDLFEFSSHAKEQAEKREIPRDIILEVLQNPDKIEIEENGQLVYQKIILFHEIKNYLVRVFVNPKKSP